MRLFKWIYACRYPLRCGKSVRFPAGYLVDNPETLTVEYEEKKVVEGKKKKEIVKTEKILQREEIKEIKDIVTF